MEKRRPSSLDVADGAISEKRQKVLPPPPIFNTGTTQSRIESWLEASTLCSSSSPGVESPTERWLECTVPPSTGTWSVTEMSDAEKPTHAGSPTYRSADLMRHGVRVDKSARTMLASVHAYANGIITGARPRLSDEDIASMRNSLANLDESDEDECKAVLRGCNLFPLKTQYQISATRFAVMTGSNIPFNRDGLPRSTHTTTTRLPGIVTPRPHLHYGYPRSSFVQPSACADLTEPLEHPRLQPLTRPNTANFLPFFAVEFRARARLGSLWEAENQNAGTGAHCVNSVETILALARRPAEARCISDSVVFTCALDSTIATLWVHWRELKGDNPKQFSGRFVSAEVACYFLQRPGELRDFHAAIRNIIEWGVGERLDMLRNALLRLVPEVPRWDREDVEARKRSAERMDDGDGDDDVDDEVVCSVGS